MLVSEIRELASRLQKNKISLEVRFSIGKSVEDFNVLAAYTEKNAEISTGWFSVKDESLDEIENILIKNIESQKVLSDYRSQGYFVKDA